MLHPSITIGVFTVFLTLCAHAQLAVAPQLRGASFAHTPESLRAAVDRASVVLPASVTGTAVFAGAYKDIPTDLKAKAPVVVFLHGSSGLGLKAIAEWQTWLATLGYASVAPDSFALADRVTYQSPIDKGSYERIHALRASEIQPVVTALASASWADSGRMVLAGASEGGPAVARYAGNAFSGRIIYSWSCETNYFVEEHGTNIPPEQPTLNIMSSTDVFFSVSNTWLGNPQAQGHCASALKNNRSAAVVLIPGAPHTLLNTGAARWATEGFLRQVFSR